MAYLRVSSFSRRCLSMFSNMSQTRYKISLSIGRPFGVHYLTAKSSEPGKSLNGGAVRGRTPLGVQHLTTDSRNGFQNGRGVKGGISISKYLGRFVYAVGGVLGMVLFGGCLVKYNYRQKLKVIDDKIKTGSRPDVSVGNERKIERKNLLNAVINGFIKGIEDNNLKDKDNFYGVIMGPTGTGKTQLIKEACSKSSEGALYFEIDGPTLSALKLAESFGMIMKGRFLDFFLSRYFPDYVGYYTLPKKEIEHVPYVLEVLEERAKLFKEEKGRPVCLFIDSVDFLAKSDPEGFKALVRLAKILAERGNLRIVFGCSEGHIIPQLDVLSEKGRSRILEVLDLSRDDGMEYLKKCGLPLELAEKVINSAGSRVLFLKRAGHTFSHCLRENIKDKDHQFEDIMDDLHSTFLNQSIKAVVKNSPLSFEVIRHLQKFDDEIGFNVSDYLLRYKEPAERDCHEKTLEALIQGNALRHTIKKLPGGQRSVNVTWHSKLVKTEVKTMVMEL